MPRRVRPSVHRYEDRLVPAFVSVPAGAVVVAPDDGGIPVVRVVNPATGEDVDVISAYEASFRGGVHAALGDVTGDGVRDVVIAPGQGGGPRVRVLDGKTGQTLADFFVYEPTYTGGVYVAVGDVNHDGRGDLVTGTGVGGGPRVRVLDGGTLGDGVLMDFFAFEDSFRGGVQVSSADVNMDGAADVFAGTGPGGAPRVALFDGKTGRVLRDYFAFDPSFRGGVQVATGRLNPDGCPDMIAGAGEGGGPEVRAFDAHSENVLADFFADSADFLGGVRVATADVNKDGADDIVTTIRRGNGAYVKLFDGRTGSFLGSFVRKVDDDPNFPDPTPHQPDGGGSGLPGGVSTFVEGTVAAVDAAAGTVTLRTRLGATVVVRAGPATEIERDDAHVPLSAFAVGDEGEALIGPDRIAERIAANSGTTGGGGGQTPTPGSTVEGTITTVDLAAWTVTLTDASRTAFVLPVTYTTVLQRNGLSATLADFQLGDHGQAEVGLDGSIAKIEATGP